MCNLNVTHSIGLGDPLSASADNYEIKTKDVGSGTQPNVFFIARG